MVCAAALVLLLSVARAASTNLSQAWDSGYYHLPFAARLAGVFTSHEYVFSRDNEARFAGFPLLGEWLQGWLWRLLGGPEYANLLGLLATVIFAWILPRVSHTPPDKRFLMSASTVLALFSVPLVMTHASSAYVDLPASCALSLSMLAVTFCSAQQLFSGPRLTLVALGLALACNMRMQHLPMAALVGCMYIARYLLNFANARRRLPPATFTLLLLLCLPWVFWVPLANLVRHGNPIYPVALTVFGKALPYAETPYTSAPDWLANVPQPVRFLASVLECGLRPWSDPARYSVDQWAPPTHPGKRMGGSFGLALLGFYLPLLICSLRRHPHRKRVGGTLLLFTLVVACLPQSHELRYTLYWLLVLVAAALCLGFARYPNVTVIGALASCIVLVCLTRAEWLRPTGSSFTEARAAKVVPFDKEKARTLGVLCIDRAPYNYFYAARYHGGGYRLVEAETDGNCAPGH
jgi:hypothetical protein